MASPSFREISLNGLWKNNPALVQLLGLCPLLGTSNSTVNALGLALASAIVLICSNTAVSLVRGVVNTAVRLPAFVMIIAALTTCIELLMQAYTYELYMQLLFGPMAVDWQVTVFPGYPGFLLAILPPGAFIVLGLLIAGKNRIDQALVERARAKQPDAPVQSRRVRVTGVIE